MSLVEGWIQVFWVCWLWFCTELVCMWLKSLSVLELHYASDHNIFSSTTFHVCIHFQFPPHTFLLSWMLFSFCSWSLFHFWMLCQFSCHVLFPLPFKFISCFGRMRLCIPLLNSCQFFLLIKLFDQCFYTKTPVFHYPHIVQWKQVFDNAIKNMIRQYFYLLSLYSFKL